MIKDFLPIQNAGQRAFLQAYASCGIIRSACLRSGVGRAEVNAWLDADADFQAAYAIANQLIDDDFEAELRDRALYGDKKPVIYKGEVIFERDPETGEVIYDDFGPKPLYVQEKSERLLVFALERRDKKKSRVMPSVNINVEFVDAPDWDAPDWDEDTGYLKNKSA